MPCWVCFGSKFDGNLRTLADKLLYFIRKYTQQSRLSAVL